MSDDNKEPPIGIGICGVNIVCEKPVGGVPSPGGLPPPLPDDALAACRDALTTTTRERDEAVTTREGWKGLVAQIAAERDEAEQHAKEQERQRIEMDEWASKQVAKAEARVGRLEEALDAIIALASEGRSDSAYWRVTYGSVHDAIRIARAARSGGTPQQGEDDK